MKSPFTIHWFTIYWFTKNCQLFPKVTVSSLLWFVFSRVVKASGCSCQLGPSHTEWSLSLSLSRGPGSVVLVCTGRSGTPDTMYHCIMTSHSPLSGKYISKRKGFSFTNWNNLLTWLSNSRSDPTWYIAPLSLLCCSLCHWFWSLVTKFSLSQTGDNCWSIRAQTRHYGNMLSPTNWQTPSIIC